MNIKIILHTSAPNENGFKCFTSGSSVFYSRVSLKFKKKKVFFHQQTQCNDRKSPLDVRVEQHFMM